MIKLRFEISDTEDGKHTLTVYGLSGDFTHGDIRNVACIFANYDDLQVVLNTAVDRLHEMYE